MFVNWKPLFRREKSKTAFTRCRHILKTVKNVTDAKLELVFTRCRNNFENGRKLDGKKSLQEFDVKEVCLHPMKRSVSFQKRLKCSVFVIFKCLHYAVSKIFQLDFRFQNLPFSKSAGKNVPFSCEREAYPSNFSPFSKCAGIV